MPRPSRPTRPKPLPPFDVPGFLKAHGVVARSKRHPRDTVLFAQGAQATSVFYIQDGGVKLSVLSAGGKEAVVGMLGPGDFFGEGCLAGQPVRMATATAVVLTTALRVATGEMLRALHGHHRRAHPAQALAGNARRDGRHNAAPRELLHEQVS